MPVKFTFRQFFNQQTDLKKLYFNAKHLYYIPLKASNENGFSLNDPALIIVKDSVEQNPTEASS